MVCNEIFRGETAVAPTNAVAKTQRTTYTLGGQLVAVRVVALDENGAVLPNIPDTGLFYLLTDHLGSVVQTLDENGSPVGNVIRYEPFGNGRYTPSQQSRQYR